MRYKITLSYDGSAFCGWQIQPHDPSVQQTLEEALSRLTGEPVKVVGAGRTDTGVNASSYVAHFDCCTAADCAQLRCKLNAILPQTIAVQSVEEADPEFHARFDAIHREYTYFLHTVKDPFLVSHSYLCTFPLDFEKMNEAARHLLGTHDFSSFEKVGADNKTSVCTVCKAAWESYEPVVGAPCGHYVFRIAADRFLRNMVRAIVGTLLEVGRGKRSVENFAALVRSADAMASGASEPGERPSLPARCSAGESVPGKALFLVKVEY